MEPRERSKNNWRMQALKEMVWLVPSMTLMALGTTLVVYQIFRKERVQRKKYIGVWRFLFVHTRAMMVALPMTVRVYVSANTTTRETLECHVPGKPRTCPICCVLPSVEVHLQRQESFCESLNACAGPSDTTSIEKPTIPENAEHRKTASTLS